MSVYSLTPVWKNSTASGNDLLVLLALADMANDGEGFAYGRVATVAVKARLSRGRCYDRLDALIELGELRMFTRGHYQSPAYVITVVDTPLDTDGIRARLADLDPEAEWVERMPGQQALPLDRSESEQSPPRYPISKAEDLLRAADQAKYAAGVRENARSGPSPEIVPNRDNLSRTATIPETEIVATARQDRRDSATTKEPYKNRSSTTTTTRVNDTVADRDNHSGSGGRGEISELEALRWARRWCELTGKTFTPRVRHRYVAQVGEYLAAGGRPNESFLRACQQAGIVEPSGWGFVSTTAAGGVTLDDCEVCENHRLRGVRSDGIFCDYDDPAADTLIRCDACQPLEETLR